MKKWHKITLVVLVIAVLSGTYFLLANNKKLTIPKSNNKKTYDVLRVNADDVTKMTINTSSKFEFTKNVDKQWTSEGFVFNDLNQEKVKTLSQDMAVIVSSIKLENLANMSEYGFENPTASFGFTTIDGKEYKFKIGKKSPVYGDYFIQKEGDNAVYLIYNYKVDSIISRFNTYRNLEPLKIDIQKLSKITLVRSNRPTVEITATNDPKYYVSWLITKPYSQAYSAVDQSVTDMVINKISALKFTDVAPDTDYAKYGIVKPKSRVAIKLSDGSEYFINVGNEQDGKVYLMVNTSKYVYIADKALVDFIDVDQFQLVTKMIGLVDIATINKVEITSGDKKYVLDILDAGNDKNTFKFNGADVKEEDARLLYQNIISLGVDDLYAKQPIGKTAVTIKYYGKTPDKNALLELKEIDERSYAFCFNSHTEFVINKTKVAQLLEMLTSSK